MSELKPNSRHLWEVLLLYFNMKESAAGAHRIISSDTCGKTTISETRTCREWFQSFKSGDFAFEDRHSGGRVEKVVEDAELETSDS
nr:Mariner Mos1 transposase [Hymenolepis microstoma]